MSCSPSSSNGTKPRTRRASGALTTKPHIKAGRRSRAGAEAGDRQAVVTCAAASGRRPRCKANRAAKIAPETNFVNAGPIPQSGICQGKAERADETSGKGAARQAFDTGYGIAAIEHFLGNPDHEDAEDEKPNWHRRYLLQSCLEPGSPSQPAFAAKAVRSPQRTGLRAAGWRQGPSNSASGSLLRRVLAPPNRKRSDRTTATIAAMAPTVRSCEAAG
jgi:hypothetical protein